MPLRQTKYGGECPLEKFKMDISGNAGSYTKDPVEVCLGCNFSNNQKEFNLEEICQCPSDLSRDQYDKLRKQYTSLASDKTKEGFQIFVHEHYKRKEEKQANSSK